MDEKLLKLIARGENEKTEFKKSTAQMERALKATCAFLNHKGGAVYFGISNKGEIIGQEVSDSTLKTISQKIRQKIKPEISPGIKVLESDDKKVIEVNVAKGTNKPYYLDGIAYKRIGSESPPIPPEELEGIILERKKSHWDSETCEGATLDDIDEEKVKWFLNKAKYERNFDIEPETPVKEALERLELMVNGNLTNSAILLFSKNPQKYFLQSKIRCARYKGLAPIDFIDMKIIEGNIIEQVNIAEKFILSHIKKAAKIVMFEREEVWEYPPDALREAVVNAVCHRNYISTSDITIGIFDNRIEISDPGKLPDPLTPKDLKRIHKSIPRNPLVANAFFLIKNIEQWGKGTNKIVEWCIEHGLKEPDFAEIAGGFMVTFYAPKDILSLIPEKGKVNLEKIGLNKRQIKALRIMVNEKKTLTIPAYANIFKVNEKTARRDLKGLVEFNFAEKVGVTKNAYFKAM